MTEKEEERKNKKCSDYVHSLLIGEKTVAPWTTSHALYQLTSVFKQLEGEMEKHSAIP